MSPSCLGTQWRVVVAPAIRDDWVGAVGGVGVRGAAASPGPGAVVGRVRVVVTVVLLVRRAVARSVGVGAAGGG